MGDHKKGRVQFVEEVGRPKDSSENEANNKSAKQPISEIKAKFQKIKEERFKNKLKSSYQTSKSTVLQTGIDNIKFGSVSESGSYASLQEERVVPDSENSQGNQTRSTRDRRMSLPSIFHPITPLPTKHGSTENIEEEPNEASLSFSRRRHSVSHVMTEYSKQNLQNLSKLQDIKLKEMNIIAERKEKEENAISKENTDNDSRKWLTGEDIHAFHNIWEKSGK